MRKILFAVLVSMIFASNAVYAIGGKCSASKGSFGSKSAPAQQKKTAAPNQAAPAAAPAANSNAAAAPAKNPSLLQSAMPALVGAAAGSYIGSKLAEDGNAEKAAENAEKKEDQFLAQ